MFDQPTRRHPVQTFQFWFIVLCSFGIVTAWKLDLFLQTDSSSLVMQEPPEEPMPPPPRELVKRTVQTSAVAVALNAEDAAVKTAPIPGVPVQTAPVQAESAQIESGTETSMLFVDAAHQQLNAEGKVRQTGDALPPPERDIIRTAYVRQISRDRESAQVASTDQTALKPNTTAPATINLAEAEQLLASGREVEALRLYSKWYWTHPERRREFQGRLSTLAARVYFQPEPHYVAPHVMQFGDRLETIAAQYQVTPQYLARLNRVDPTQLRAGQTLKVLQGAFSAVVDLSDMELTVHSNGYFLVNMRVGLGDNMQLPPGRYQISEKSIAPISPAVDTMGGTAGNVTVKRWLALSNETGSLNQQGIHGTDDPSLIGKTGSPGCIRLSNRDIDALFDLLVDGAEVVVKP